MKEKELISSITNYIYNNLVKSEPSIKNSNYLLEDKIKISVDYYGTTPEIEVIKDVYGITSKIDNKDLFILYVKKQSENDISDILIVKLQDAPAYGISMEYDGVIGMNINDTWTKCSVYFAASFLAGMEYFKDNCLNYTKLENKDTIELAYKFIEFLENYEE